MLNRELNTITMKQAIEELKSIKETAPTSQQRRYQKSSIYWYDIPCAFDTETTNTHADGRKIAFVYEFTFGIADKIYIMRTWDEFREMCFHISQIFELDEQHRIACYIHNEGFEFQFMRHYFNWIDVFSTEQRKPIRALCDLGIEFRDSAILSASNLDTLAKNLHSHTIRKLKGDLDYTLIRTSSTPMTDEEYGYCINDVQILLYYIEEQLEEYHTISKIPMTNTGRVREYCRHHCLEIDNGDKKPLRNLDYISLMRQETMNDELYAWAKLAFRGGFTHANARKTGIVLPNVGSYDLTSAYPSMMVSKLFPFGTPEKFYPESKDHFLNALDCRCCLFNIEFYNIRLKPDAPDSYISWIPSKMNGDRVRYDDNGRVVKADRLEMWMTEVDFSIINETYDCDDFAYGEYMYIWFKDHLPKELVECVLKFYQDKTTLKGVPEEAINYMRSKGMLNSCYGMCVQDPIKDTATYDGEWTDSKSESTMDSINHKSTRFTYYPWGLWVTAYCRRRIWDAILNAGAERQCYTDTDSIKVERWWELTDWFNDYNEGIRKEMQEAMDYYGLPYDLIEPKTVKGVPKLLGAFDFEGTYAGFKTLGAKRYMTSHAEVKRINEETSSCLRFTYEITVAGLPKPAVDWFEQFKDPFAEFKNDCCVPASHSRKLLHTFIDAPWEGDITDYTGHTEHVSVPSSVHLEAMDFNMSMSSEYMDWLVGLQTDRS